jgi:2-dehydropantoate 2-reductase
MGSLLGHGFLRAGHDVSLIDTPQRVAQLNAVGTVTVIAEDGEESEAGPFRISWEYDNLGEHEIVVLATKAQHLPVVAEKIDRLTTSGSTILTIQNGIPWWYLQGLPSPYGGRRLHCLDPAGTLERAIDPASIVGCVAYPAAGLEPDGRVRHVEGKRFALGELDGCERERTRQLAALFDEAGYKSRIIDDIRSEIWLKAWGSLSINPISALTRATMEDICSYPETRDLVALMMREAQDVAEALGAHFRHTIEHRIEGARAVGPHKTSMLQDVENGRSLEIDALMLAVLELAALVGKPAPMIQSVYACTALLNKTLTDQTHTAPLAAS